MPERNYMLCAPNKQGELDVVAKFQEEDPLSTAKLKVIIKEILRNGTIIRDGNGKHHLVEKGQEHG